MTFFLFSLTYRCLAILFPMSDWCRAYAIQELPPPPPSGAQRIALREKASSEQPFPVATAYLQTARSLGQFLLPWPSPETRKRVQTPGDAGKCTACWLYGRVLFLEHVCGLNEYWPLYAPSVDTYIINTRARLCFGDGSDIVLRQRASRMTTRISVIGWRKESSTTST